MLGSVVLDVAIGLIFVYLLISLMVTAVTELIAALLKSRAKNLWEGVRNILDSGTARTWVDQLYDHPLVAGLSTPRGGQASGTGTVEKPRYGPSYIPSRTFAVSLLEIVREPRRALQQQIDAIPDTASLAEFKEKLNAWADRQPWKDQARGWIQAIPDNVSTADAKAALRKVAAADLQEVLGSIPDDKLRRSLLALYDEAKGDVDELKKNIEIWFNNSMDRVSGWYKRNTQAVNFAIASVIVLFMNVDTVLIVQALSENPALREVIVEQAQAYAEAADETGETAGAAQEAGAAGNGQSVAASRQQFQELQREVEGLGLPIGWSLAPEPRGDSENTDFRWFPALDVYLWGQTLRFHLLGWLVSIFAVSLGAPFWFDMLNKVISIRSSGRAPEEKPKSPEKVPQPREPGNVPATPDAQKVVVEFRGAAG